MIKVVGSAIIKNKNGDLLAVRLDKEEKGGVLVPPGGKLEENESVRECIVREVKEELNVDIEILALAGIAEEKYEDGEWLFVYYSAKIISGEPQIMEPEKILELNWVDISELKNYNHVKWVN